MAKNPDDRCETAGQLAQAAHAVIAGTTDLSTWTTEPISDSAPTQLSTGAVPPPTATRSKRWLPVAAAVVVLVLVAAGIGIWRFTGDDQSDSAAVDLTQLDTGRYDTEPRPLSGTSTEDEGRYLEGFRLAETHANPFDIDERLVYLAGQPIIDPAIAATSIAVTGTPLVQPVLERYNMLAAYFSRGFSVPASEFISAESSGPKASVLTLVTEFANNEIARQAATDMEAVDFEVSPLNERLEIPGYPEAIAHWRPGFASVGTTIAVGRLVATVLVLDNEVSGVDELVQMTLRVLDVSVPLMQKHIPVPEATLATLPLDPDNILSRSFVDGEQPPISSSVGVVGPRAVWVCASNLDTVRKDFYGQAGVDRRARTPSSTVLRAEDESAANELVQNLFDGDADEYFDHDIGAPEGITATCYEQKEAAWANNANNRYFCLVSFKRYVALISSNEEDDARQRAAAQYAILVNSA